MKIGLKLFVVIAFLALAQAHAADSEDLDSTQSAISCGERLEAGDPIITVIIAALKTKTPEGLKRALDFAKSSPNELEIKKILQLRFIDVFDVLGDYEGLVYFARDLEAVGKFFVPSKLIDALDQLGRHDEAIAVFHRADNLAPQTPRSHKAQRRWARLRIKVSFWEHDYQNALDLISGLDHLDMTPPIWKIEQFILENNLAAYRPRNNAEFDRRKRCVDLAGKINQLNSTRKYSEALTAAEDYIDECGETSAIRKEIALSYYNLKNYPAAFKAINRWVELDGRIGGGWAILAKIQMRMSLWEMAIESIASAILFSQDGQATTNYLSLKAESLIKLGRLNEAELILRENPSIKKASSLLVKIALARGNPVLALAVLRDLPSTPGIQWLRARSYFAMKNLAKANELLAEMLFDPRSEKAWVLVAMLKIHRMGESHEMPQILKKAVASLGPAASAKYIELADTLDWGKIVSAEENAIDEKEEESSGSMANPFWSKLHDQPVNGDAMRALSGRRGNFLK